MYFDRALNKWMPHPLCRCGHDPCYCSNLPPLDANGKPIGTVGALGPSDPAQRRLRYCEMCDDWTRKTECPKCGMPTVKAA